MAFRGLTDYIATLDKKNELQRISSFIDPLLEITEITDRVTKSGGKALLFEDTGTRFPVLINGFGSDHRMALALGRDDLDEAGNELENIFSDVSGNTGTIFKKLSSIPTLLRLAGFLPSKSGKKGICQQVIHKEPDLGVLPILKCWPHDGGRFITLPIVHTVHPETGKTNAGMYRMQVLDKNTTAMHWQRHKTGANHFEAWKHVNKRMPVSVALGGDPVYTYSATAPLPENIDEYILAGFLRKKMVKLVKCLTNDLYVPDDADIIIEGYVDPAEELVWEGPFGDHTGFYSLADWYPRFHVTCITHSKKAVYPATIVGIPPQEDAWLAKATEKIFLSPLKLTIQPEVEDFHMPDAGIAHNLVIVKIKKTYPGQGMKVISALFGAGQMMFSKYIVVVSGDIDIRKYGELIVHVFKNIDFGRDLYFSRGPLDVLDHSSDNYSFGGKAGLDATVKLAEENSEKTNTGKIHLSALSESMKKMKESGLIASFNLDLFDKDIHVLIITVNPSKDQDVLEKVKRILKADNLAANSCLILVADHTINPENLHMVAWQILGNSDPQRDHEFLSSSTVLIDGTIKAYRKGGFTRRWPNIVCSDHQTISAIDNKWATLGIGPLLLSPSLKNMVLCRYGEEEIIVGQEQK